MGMKEPVLCVALHEPALKGICCASGVLCLSLFSICNMGSENFHPSHPTFF